MLRATGAEAGSEDVASAIDAVAPVVVGPQEVRAGVLQGAKVGEGLCVWPKAGGLATVRDPNDLGTRAQAGGPVDGVPASTVGLLVGGGFADAEGVEGHLIALPARAYPLHSEVEGGPAPLGVAASPVSLPAVLGAGRGGPREAPLTRTADGLDPAAPCLVRQAPTLLHGEVGEATLVPDQVLPNGRVLLADEARVGVGRVEGARLTRRAGAGPLGAGATAGQGAVRGCPGTQADAAARRDGVARLDGGLGPLGRGVGPPVDVRVAGLPDAQEAGQRWGHAGVVQPTVAARRAATSLEQEVLQDAEAAPGDVVGPRLAGSEAGDAYVLRAAPAAEAGPCAGHGVADAAPPFLREAQVVAAALPTVEAALSLRADAHDPVAPVPGATLGLLP